ncbi:MAG: hypothetical protein K0Q73_6553, partial [Paenibacillus sp.]|nr:hypothetical protein [Paenibacillus sp.]
EKTTANPNRDLLSFELYLFAGTLSDMNNFMVNIIYDLSAVVTCYLGGLILDYFKK